MGWKCRLGLRGTYGTYLKMEWNIEKEERERLVE